MATTLNEFHKQLLIDGEQCCSNSADFSGHDASVESSMDDLSSALGGMNFQGACGELGARYKGNMTKDCGSSMDAMSSAFGGMNFEDVGVDPTADAAATSQGNKLTMSRRRIPRGGERIRAFNTSVPNFLLVVPDPDAEKVDLRHQMTDDRKNAEEWMVDYALRRTVNKLARAQKRKVEMLVQASETVLPPVLGEKNYLQDDDKKSLAKCN